MKLDFIVVGAAKSGTTALHQTLGQINQLSLFKALSTSDYLQLAHQGNNMIMTSALCLYPSHLDPCFSGGMGINKYTAKISHHSYSTDEIV